MSSEWDVELRTEYHCIIPKDKNKKVKNKKFAF